MSDERIRYIRTLETLVPLSEHTDALAVNEEGRLEVRRRIPAPLDEYGIPRPEIMIERLLGLMATKNYVWPGRFDEHHLATPKADFTVIRTPSEGDIGSAFRGLSCLKIELPRQMHNFSHAVFELPGRPSVDVMRQAVTEVGQAKRLRIILNEHQPMFPHEETERMKRLCTDDIHAVLEKMDEPQVALLPPIETLAGMDLGDLRATVNSLLRTRRFSKKHLVHPAVRKTSSGSGLRTAA